MTRRLTFAIGLWLGSTVWAATPTLGELEAKAPTGDVGVEGFVRFAAEVFRLVESNTLKTADEFWRASQLAAMGYGEFRSVRVTYELLLVAAVKDFANAEREVPEAWDRFMFSVGRPMRMEPAKISAHESHDEGSLVELAPEVIRAVWREPAKARAAAKGVSDNAEIKEIVDADQAVRQSDWSKLTPEDHVKIAAGDRARNARIRQIIAAGDLRTAEDFARASLVMQHSSAFAGYRLAHELAVASMLLGDRQTGRWLVAATYDRMLNSIGHDQRFGTQYMGSGPMPTDDRGICDEERVAIGCAPLAKAAGDALVRKAEAALASGDFVDAEKAAREGIVKRTQGYPSGAWQIASAQRALGASLLGQKKYPEAETVLFGAYAGLKAKQSDIPTQFRVRVRDAARLLAQLYRETDRPAHAVEWEQRVAEFDRSADAPPKQN